MLKRFLLFTFLFLCFDFGAVAQFQKASFQHIPIAVNSSLRQQELETQLDSAQLHFSSEAIGKFIKSPLNLLDSYTERHKKHSTSSWKIRTGDLGSRVFFKQLELQSGDSLFTYSINGDLLEITTSENIYGQAFTSVYSFGGLIFQLKNYSKKAEVEIDGYSLEIKKAGQFNPQDFGESENCQVNINCSEGEEFRDIQKSTVRILIKAGSFFLWCTGSLINNTSYNYEPYILSAEHCGLLGNGFAPQSDLDNWTFYFNYESPDCENPLSEGNLDQQRITGANLLANSDDGGGDFGSDFMLLKLSSFIPNSFGAYYSGWNHQVQSIPKSGVGIHHPSGDIKKISTYLYEAESGSFANSTSNTHWIVKWQKTFNGFGTTEQGSSGSPLFDEYNLIRGVLTGGGSACNNLNGQDFYGKLSYSWNSNGQASNRRLDVWLDPNNTGYLAISGAYEGDPKPDLSGEEIEIYPVPATSGFIKIKNIGRPQESIGISISSLEGRQLYSSKIVALPGEDFILELHGWAAGMYIIQIDQNGTFKEKKFFIGSND